MICFWCLIYISFSSVFLSLVDFLFAYNHHYLLDFFVKIYFMYVTVYIYSYVPHVCLVAVESIRSPELYLWSTVWVSETKLRAVSVELSPTFPDSIQLFEPLNVFWIFWISSNSLWCDCYRVNIFWSCVHFSSLVILWFPCLCFADFVYQLYSFSWIFRWNVSDGSLEYIIQKTIP